MMEIVFETILLYTDLCAASHHRHTHVYNMQWVQLRMLMRTKIRTEKTTKIRTEIRTEIRTKIRTERRTK